MLGLPGASSTAFVATNAATISNSGIETQLTMVPLRVGGNVDWTIQARYAKNTNRVEELSGSTAPVALGPTMNGLTLQAAKGFGLGALVGSAYRRDPNTKPCCSRADILCQRRTAGIGHHVAGWQLGGEQQLSLWRVRAIGLGRRPNWRQHFQHDESAWGNDRESCRDRFSTGFSGFADYRGSTSRLVSRTSSTSRRKRTTIRSPRSRSGGFMTQVLSNFVTFV